MEKSLVPVAVGPQFQICYNLAKAHAQIKQVAVGPQFQICYNWLDAVTTDGIVAVGPQFQICYNLDRHPETRLLVAVGPQFQICYNGCPDKAMKSIGFFRTFFVKNGSMVTKGACRSLVFSANRAHARPAVACAGGAGA